MRGPRRAPAGSCYSRGSDPPAGPRGLCRHLGPRLRGTQGWTQVQPRVPSGAVGGVGPALRCSSEQRGQGAGRARGLAKLVAQDRRGPTGTVRECGWVGVVSVCFCVCARGTVLVSLRGGVGVCGAIGASVDACTIYQPVRVDSVCLFPWCVSVYFSVYVCVCVCISGCGDGSPKLDSLRVSYGPSLGGRQMVWAGSQGRSLGPRCVCAECVRAR